MHVNKAYFGIYVLKNICGCTYGPWTQPVISIGLLVSGIAAAIKHYGLWDVQLHFVLAWSPSYPLIGSYSQ